MKSLHANNKTNSENQLINTIKLVEQTYLEGEVIHDFTNTLTIVDRLTLKEKALLSVSYNLNLKIFILRIEQKEQLALLLASIKDRELIRGNDVVIFATNQGIKYLTSTNPPANFSQSTLEKAAEEALPDFSLESENRSGIGLGLETLIMKILKEVGHGNWLKNRLSLAGILLVTITPIFFFTVFIPFYKRKKKEFNSKISQLKSTLNSKETYELEALEPYRIEEQLMKWIQQVEKLDSDQKFLRERTQLDQVYEEVKVALKLPGGFFPRREEEKKTKESPAHSTDE